MPTYQYACTDCDHAFEQVQSFSEDSLTTCPACEGRLRKIFNAVGVVFKGSGFYRTDNRPDNRKDKSGDATSSAPSASTGDTPAKGKEPAATKTPAKASAKSEAGAA